jgi:predicted signal transduction protein with EAL and GGDEF domain
MSKQASALPSIRVDGDDAKTLLRRTDLAMYRAKSNDRNGLQRFKPRAIGLLEHHSCNVVLGYRFATPMPAAAAHTFIRKFNAGTPARG